MSLEDELDRTQKEFQEKRFSFIRYIVLLVSGILSVLVTFHKTNPIQPIQNNQVLVFDTSLILIGLCILSGLVSLYGEIYMSGKIVGYWFRNKLKQDRNEKTDGFSLLNMPKIFRWCEIQCYLFLGLSIISLVACVIIS